MVSDMHRRRYVSRMICVDAVVSRRPEQYSSPILRRAQMFETGSMLVAQGVKNMLPASSKLPTTRIVEYVTCAWIAGRLVK